MNSNEQQQLEALVRTIIRSNTGKGPTSKLLRELAGVLPDSLMFSRISKLLAYRKGLRTVQKVTGLDPPKAHRLYLAFVAGNWSKIPIADLRILREPDWTDPATVRPVLNDWADPNFSLERQLTTAIWIERSRRKTLQEWEQILEKIAGKKSSLRHNAVASLSNSRASLNPVSPQRHRRL